MPHWAMHVSMAADSALPRDRFVNVLHFNDSGLGTDPTSLASDLAAIYKAIWDNGNAREIIVKAYDAEGSKPVYPQADIIRHAGIIPASTGPREQALCLSFYSERNVPSKRGRIYIPVSSWSATWARAVRPPEAARLNVLSMATAFANLGGADVDWEVWSTKNQTGHAISQAWVDDEWDVQRRRGLKSTTRSSLGLSEN